MCKIISNDPLYALLQIMVYLIGKLNKKLVILTFDQFDHLIILDKLNMSNLISVSFN
jgi:hypothetical protein